MSGTDKILSHHLAQALKPFAPKTDRKIKLIFSVHRLRDRLDFNFMLSGRVPADLEKIKIPDVADQGARRRRDEIWKSTCLEIFVGRSDRNSYFEINLCPSGDWNVYAFEKYREGMRVVSEAQAPLVRFERAATGDFMTWHAQLRSGGLGGVGSELEAMFTSPALVMSATAVLDFRNDGPEYWAINHAGEKPDFHLRESFRLPL